MKTRLALAALMAAFVLPTSPVSAQAADCEVFLCAQPPECREVMEALFKSKKRVDTLERRIEKKNATIKHLRAQLAAAQR